MKFYTNASYHKGSESEIPTHVKHALLMGLFSSMLNAIMAGLRNKTIQAVNQEPLVFRLKLR